jgi:hypothetical protein
MVFIQQIQPSELVLSYDYENSLTLQLYRPHYVVIHFCDIMWYFWVEINLVFLLFV